MTSLEMELKKIWYMMLSNFRVRFLFAFGIVMELINVAVGAGSYFFLTRVFPPGTADVMSKYGTDVVSYIILGIALNSMLMQSLTGIFSSLVESYYDRSLERISLSPTNIYTLILTNMMSGYFNRALNTILYLVIGLAIFGMNLGSGNGALALLVLILGLAATVGLGMLLCLVFFYTATGKGGPSPILMFAYTFTNAFSGATFPIEVIIEFAPWLFLISAFLPQTHAISAIRMILNGSSLFDASVFADIAYLIVFSAITIPIGYYLIRRGLDKVRREGYVPPSEGIWLFG